MIAAGDRVTLTAVHDGTNRVCPRRLGSTTDLDREDTARILERGTARAILKISRKYGVAIVQLP